MNVRNATHIGFTRSVRGCPADAQAPVNANAGAALSYDASEVTGEWVVHQHPEPPIKGRGITVYVYMLALLPDEGIEQLADMMAELAASYSVVVETATGLRSDDRVQRRKMIDFARASLSLRRRARLPVGIAKRGRRAVEFTTEQVEAGRKVWTAKKYISDGAAAEDLPEGMTINHARRLYGSSGRAPGRKPMQKRKR